MNFNDKDRLKHAVIETASWLAGIATGTCDGMQLDELVELRDWLAWRIEHGWTESIIPSAIEYEDSVRAMARAALALFDSKCGHWFT